VSSARGDENAMIENNDNKNSKASENENIQVSPSSPRVLLLADDPAVSDQIMKARKLLDDARKKQAREQEVVITPSSSTPTTAIPSTAANTSRLPFFVMVDDGSRASTTSINSKKIKSTTSSGSIIADGETMTQISSTEQWSRRKLSEMFSKESHLDYAGKSIDDQTIDKVGTVLADRDVVASIWNLRKTLQNEDFARVFDKRNRFIGDLD
jgi:lipoprotein-anchoring transpeptidase ErfK/SrfK